MRDGFGLPEKVILAALSDDEEAFCALIRASQSDLRSVVRPHVEEPDEVEAILNATYMRLWEMRQQVSAGSVRPVLVAIANQVIEKRSRQMQRRQLVQKYIPWVPRANNPRDDRDPHRLERVINNLPADVAVAMEMKHIHGFALQQIANLLGVAVHDIEDRLNYGRTFLKIRKLNEE